MARLTRVDAETPPARCWRCRSNCSLVRVTGLAVGRTRNRQGAPARELSRRAMPGILSPPSVKPQRQKGVGARGVALGDSGRRVSRKKNRGVHRQAPACKEDRLALDSAMHTASAAFAGRVRGHAQLWSSRLGTSTLARSPISLRRFWRPNRTRILEIFPETSENLALRIYCQETSERLRAGQPRGKPRRSMS